MRLAIRSAAGRFADPDTPDERIRAIDDLGLSKVKARRSRCVVRVGIDGDLPVAGDRRATRGRLA